MQEGDKLLWVGQCQEDSSVLLASSAGKALHLPTTGAELRPLGRPARGLRVPLLFIFCDSCIASIGAEADDHVFFWSVVLTGSEI